MKRKDSEIGGDDDSLLLNVELAAGAVSSILKDSDLKKSSVLAVDEALAISLQGVFSVSSHILSCLVSILCWILTLRWVLQVATHLKSLAKKAKLNEGHAKAA